MRTRRSAYPTRGASGRLPYNIVMQTKLILTSGLPGSGKSTIAERLSATLSSNLARALWLSRTFDESEVRATTGGLLSLAPVPPVGPVSRKSSTLRESQTGSPAKLMNRIWVAMPMLEMLFCYAARKTRCRSRSKFARPYMVRLISLSRFTWPSVWPLLHTIVSPARTAASSASSPVAKRWSC